MRNSPIASVRLKPINRPIRCFVSVGNTNIKECVAHRSIFTHILLQAASRNSLSRANSTQLSWKAEQYFIKAQRGCFVFLSNQQVISDLPVYLTPSRDRDKKGNSDKWSGGKNTLNSDRQRGYDHSGRRFDPSRPPSISADARRPGEA